MLCINMSIYRHNKYTRKKIHLRKGSISGGGCFNKHDGGTSDWASDHSAIYILIRDGYPFSPFPAHLHLQIHMLTSSLSSYLAASAKSAVTLFREIVTEGNYLADIV